MNFTLESFLFDIPLYSKIKIDQFNHSEFEALIYPQDKKDIDGYNPYKKAQTTFETIRKLSYSINDYETNGGFGEFKIRCKRFGDIFRYYCFYEPKSKTLLKIGQFPSVGEINVHQIKQYDKVLSQEKLKEFTRAIGLASNGIGIGSFIYLRRVFEHLIQQAYLKAQAEDNINKGMFQFASMDEKIELLNDYLPSFLAEHKELCSLLSIDIHEMNDHACLQHFDTLRVGIEIILDEQLEELLKSKKIETVKAKIEVLKRIIKK